ncbi:hypothetical protein FOCC_FOCC001702 [Frankliniella occidentalis]|nr:hypothetical protein FOCC_FOCC001702 [Frankliniella occidentalis]
MVVNGTVVYNLLVPLRAPCLSDASRWPYDRVVCNMSIVNLSPGTAKLNNSAMQIGLVRWRSRGWSLKAVSMKPFRSPGFLDGLLVRVEAKRSAAMHEATAVVPVVLLTPLMLASLWLPAHTPQRPLLLCSVILLQIMLSVVVPLHIKVVGVRPPDILLLLRDSLLVSGAALLQWMLARWLLLREPAAWPWPLGVLADLAADGGSHLGAVLCLPPVSGQDCAQSGASDHKAIRMSAITDRTTFVVLTVLSVALSVRLLP